MADTPPPAITPEAIVGLAGGIEQPTLSPDGSQVALTLNLDGIRQLCVMPAGGGWPRRITAERQACSDPAWAPDSARLAFVRDNGLWVADLRDGALRRLWGHEAGLATPRWSPDGGQIAFYSRQRGWDQIWVVVVAAAPGERPTPRCLTPGRFDHAGLSWSPNGELVAYASLRSDLNNVDLYVAPTSGEPVERPVSVARGFDGGPAFLPDGRLSFVSEADGWLHVYVADLAAGQATQLTSGPHENGDYYFEPDLLPRPSPDGGQIAFVRHAAGLTHVLEVPATGGPARQRSTRAGFHTLVGWLPADQGLLVTFETMAQPRELYRLDRDGGYTQLTWSQPPTPGLASLPAPERVRFTARDGLPIEGVLLRPPGLAADQLAPLVVWPHGGPSDHITQRWRPLWALLAANGYAVFGPDFRGSTGYGRAFRQANFGEWGHADLHDILDGVAHVAALPGIDPARAAIFGGSYGGYMVLCALAFAPTVFRCGIDLFGDSDIAESYRRGDRPGRQDLERQMGRPDEQAELYRRGSPLFFAERIEAPLLILHGRDDMRVVPLMSEKMVEALKIENKYHEAHFYEGEGHGIRQPANHLDMMQRVLAFLKRHLRDEE